MSEGQKMSSLVSVSPDPEVTPEAKRRNFSAAYKKKILAEVDAASGTGDIGEVLRREGVYSSTLTSWRKERDAAVHNAFSQKRGPQPKQNPLTGSLARLRVCAAGGFRFGVAGIIGLIPGIGDALDALISLCIVICAIHLGVPRVTRARMLVNVGVEALARSVPFIGDLFDVVFKANRSIIS